MTTRKYACTQKAADDLLGCAGRLACMRILRWRACVRACAVSRQMEYALNVINLLAATVDKPGSVLRYIVPQYIRL